MEFISFLLIIAILVLLVSLRNNFTERMSRLENEVRRLQEQLTKSITAKPHTDIVKADPLPAPPQPVPVKETWESGFKREETISARVEPVMKETAPEIVHATSPTLQNLPPKVPKPGFFERNPDLEKFIGENLVSKIGIGILVLAIGFFVKYAIDNEWIPPVGRVAIGMFCGGILLAVGHYTRNSYKAFSSVLVGGALAVFYFTIALAYHEYALFSQAVAFVIMVIITLMAVVLSGLYNRQELAVIALVGGFAAPFMVSNGDGNYVTLFIYLIILNLGLLVIAYKKAWRLLNLLAFLFTVLLFGVWLITLDDNEAAIAYRNAFIFATIFYLLFFAINIAHNIKERKKFIASDFGILLANTGLYFATGLYCLTEIYAEEFRGFFCIAMGVFNLGATYFLLRKNKIDNNILYLLIGITFTFISLTAPVQLQGNNITLFWATEAVLLYWLYQKSRIMIIQYSSLIIWVCMLISLLMDWVAVYSNTSVHLTILANRGFVTSLFAGASTGMLFILRKKEPAEKTGLPVTNVYLIVSLLLLYAAGFLEINHQFRNHYPSIQLNIMYLLCYTQAFILLLQLVAQKKAFFRISRNVSVALLMACIFLYLLCAPAGFYIQRQMLEQNMFKAHYLVHWLTVVLTGIIIYKLFRNIKELKNAAFITWPLCAMLVIFLTVELHLIINVLFYSASNPLPEIQRVFIKTGWPILWGLCSFVFMWLGMRYKFRPLRIVSLTLFLITLIKLFVYDIRNIPVAGKIAAFFSLGVLLLIVSFMYQRLKKIIIDSEQGPAGNQ